MKKIVLAIFLLISNLFSLMAQCPSNAGSNKNVCPSFAYDANAVQIGPSEPWPGAWSNLTFSWSPSTGLNNPNIRNPYALPDETTTYTLTVTGGGCGTLNFNVTVRVAGIISITNPNGSTNRVKNYYNIYYPYEGTYNALLSNDDPDAEWWLYDDATNTYRQVGTGLTYELEFTGLGDIWHVPTVLSYTAANPLGCNYLDEPQIITHGVYSNGYPVTVTGNYYAYSACGPTLPATISQVSSIDGNTPTYEWTLQGANSSYWSITSPSGSSATLNRNGGTPPVSNDIYTRAYVGSSPAGQYLDGAEVWMNYGVGYHAGGYPTCYPMRPAPGAPAVVKTESTTKPVTTTEIFKTQIYPNPVSSLITISSKNPVDRIEIYNSAGVQVKSIAGYAKNILYVNTNGLGSGFYMIKLIGAKGTELLKMVKQ